MTRQRRSRFCYEQTDPCVLLRNSERRHPNGNANGTSARQVFIHGYEQMPMASPLQTLIKLDHEISRRLTLKPDLVALRRLAAIGAHLGDGWIWINGSVTALVLGTPPTRRLVLWLAVAILLSVSVGTVIKYAVRRPRPSDLKGFYSRRVDNYSFPSGHAIRVACIAVVLGIAFPQWSALLGLYASLVALCRVSLGIHYLSDVLVGLTLGTLGGLLMVGLTA